MKGYKRILFIGIIVIVLGTTLSTTLSDEVKPIGIVFIGIGGLMFIIGMNRKNREDLEKSEGSE